MSSSKSRHLGVYLTATAGAATLLSASQADAAVTAVSFGFGNVRDASDGLAYNATVGPGFGNMFSYWQTTTGTIGGTELAGAYLSGVGIGRIVFFSEGTVIGAGGNGSTGSAYFSHRSIQARNFGADQLNKNIAFKTSSNNWGWANVDWNEAAKSVTFNAAYVESVANTPIIVGAVAAAPEPSRALLALAGIAGVALRRRRKQVV